jgi:sugar-phosphatase
MPAAECARYGVLFDVDGVLLDSIPAYQRAWRAWAGEYGIDEDLIWVSAHGRRPIDIVRLNGLADEPRALGRFEELIGVEYEQVPAMSGAGDVLARIASAWAVVTSGDGVLVRRAFARLGLPMPRVGVCGADVAVGKPDPACYRLAAQRLYLDPQACVVVEDAPTGVAAGKAADMTVIAVSTTHTPRQLYQADLVLPSLHELVEAVQHVTSRQP